MEKTVPTLPAAAAPLHRCADPACGLEFMPHKPWQKYHSPRCRRRHWSRRRERPPGLALSCPHCRTTLALALQPSP